MRSSTAPTGPSPAITELDGWTLQPLEPVHAPIVAELLGQRGHRYLLDVPADASTLAGMLQALVREPWSLPLAVVREGECTGVVTTALPNLKSLHASFTALFVDPAGSTLPLALCLRHLFWTFPLHRLHAQIPALDLTREYVDLLQSVGFVEEGRLVDHVVIGGQEFDMVAMGLLRGELERWLADHEPRLALG